MFGNFTYRRPEKLAQAVEELKTSDARVHAGGTDLLGCLREGIFPAEKVVSLSGLTRLRGMKNSSAGLGIGALTTIAEVAAHEAVRQHWAGLAQAASEVASPQLRNQGTIGGNLCQKPRCWYYRGDFPCLRKGGQTCFAQDGENQFHCIFGGSGCVIVHPSDTAPALAALGATIEILGPSGKRSVRADSFHVLPEIDPTRETVLEQGEIVTAVQVPAPESGQRSSYRKVRTRRSWDFAIAGLALSVVFDGDVVKSARAFLSGAAPVPWRTKPLEAAITGRSIDERTAKAAADAAMKAAQPLSGNAYKVPLFKSVIEQELLAIRPS